MGRHSLQGLRQEIFPSGTVSTEPSTPAQG